MLNKKENLELQQLKLFIETMEEHITYKRKELRQMNTSFNRAKKKAKELINKQD